MTIPLQYILLVGHIMYIGVHNMTVSSWNSWEFHELTVILCHELRTCSVSYLVYLLRISYSVELTFFMICEVFWLLGNKTISCCCLKEQFSLYRNC